MHSTFVPRIESSSDYLATFVGILGTTISPYLFFWQASQEVEEERKIGRRTVMGERINPPVLRWLGWGTAVIMAAAAVAMFATM